MAISIRNCLGPFLVKLSENTNRGRRLNVALMTGEKVLLESDNKDAALTTHRVRYESKRLGFANVVSIMLESLTSCQITHRSYPWLLVLAVALAGLAVYFITLPGSDLFAKAAFILASASAIAYVLTRRGIVSLASPTAAVRFRATSRMAAERFIDAVESAKNDRYYAGRQNERPSMEKIER